MGNNHDYSFLFFFYFTNIEIMIIYYDYLLQLLIGETLYLINLNNKAEMRPFCYYICY